MKKRIYNSDGTFIEASNINAYLFDGPSVFIERRETPLFGVPKMLFGNMPRDGGNLIIESEDLDAFVERDPRSKKFIRPMIGAEEFLHGKSRYCLWLIDAEPSEIKSIKPIHERVKACKEFRLASKAKSTQAAAKTPWLFVQIAQPTSGNFIVVPEVSAGRREYIPMGYLDFNTIVTNLVLFIPNGSLWLFGILMSRVHMAWTKVVAGSLGTSIRYSAQVVYNNFPFHKPTPEIEVTAKKILDARSNYPNSTLADLYDPDLMPIELRRAHEENDRAVLDCYEIPRTWNDIQIVSTLFEVYQEMIEIKENEKS